MIAAAHLQMLPSGRNARLRDIWEIPTSFPAGETFFTQVPQFLLKNHLYMKLFQRSKDIFSTFSSGKWLPKLNVFVADALHANECLFRGIAVKHSALNTNKQGRNVFFYKLLAEENLWATILAQSSIVKLSSMQ